ncbi:uncharacterized protein KIAA0930 homolog isoform X2 [Brassica rapa]|uniref:uncharacterized protein KIAA0930 homolog isoform X2 n=1 Tax=Brassica campestris TaxID=3711 RepID=UPI0004F1967F|nr:uncharacterized protein KIAA0930 homolog isoform X2 [Brassica rapa]XP_013748789.2 uncharacterized protein KIAA0930 homolog isoform X2 [Brassica napus]
MLNDREETLTRHEILSMVKKHSKSLGKTSLDEQEASDVEMDSNFWHGVFDVYFVRCMESRRRQDDDLLFFVRKLSCKSYGLTDNEDAPAPYFVRRWAPKLDVLLGETLAEVDWRKSFYLNMVAHTSFTVTVAICSNEALKKYQGSKDTTLSPIYKVVKTVYASPSRVNFHLDSKKEVETTPAYPEICFAVDDFDSTFDAVVLTEKDHCYCVLLNSHDGAAFPSADVKTDKDSSGSNTNTDPRRVKDPKVTLFSGFVSYQMVREAYEGGRNRFGSLLSLGHHSGKADRLYMKGPGGRGEVEVAVSGVIAKHAIAAATASYDEDEMFPLKCCLMSISLPWDTIAHDLLFKGSPPVNME